MLVAIIYVMPDCIPHIHIHQSLVEERYNNAIALLRELKRDEFYYVNHPNEQDYHDAVKYVERYIAIYNCISGARYSQHIPPEQYADHLYTLLGEVDYYSGNLPVTLPMVQR